MPRKMTGPPSHSASNLLPHLAATLRDNRKAQGLTWRAMEQYGRERSTLYRFEQYADGREPDVKYWPNVDDYVSVYSRATGVPVYALWAEAVRRALEAEARFRRGANREILSRGADLAGALLGELAALSEGASESPTRADPKSRR